MGLLSVLNPMVHSYDDGQGLDADIVMVVPLILARSFAQRPVLF